MPSHRNICANKSNQVETNTDNTEAIKKDKHTNKRSNKEVELQTSKKIEQQKQTMQHENVYMYNSNPKQ